MNIVVHPMITGTNILPFLDVCWLEWRNKERAKNSAYHPTAAFVVDTFTEGGETFYKLAANEGWLAFHVLRESDYNKVWRTWFHKPSAEDMETEWED